MFSKEVIGDVWVRIRFFNKNDIRFTAETRRRRERFK
jgi:hypothetical protein